VVEGGDLYTCGAGCRGQLGHGDLERLEFPRLVESLVGVPIMAVAGGSAHSLVLTRNGRVFAFGYGEHGALGGGDYVSSSDPQLVTALIDQRVTEIAAGAHSSASRNRAGLVWTWGSNLNLTLGHNHGDEPPPVQRVCTPTLLMVPEWSSGGETELMPLDLLRQPHSGHWALTDYNFHVRRFDVALKLTPRGGARYTLPT
jgi:alpha-tubulin suppressor-like RCC1 family protein